MIRIRGGLVAVVALSCGLGLATQSRAADESFCSVFQSLGGSGSAECAQAPAANGNGGLTLNGATQGLSIGPPAGNGNNVTTGVAQPQPAVSGAVQQHAPAQAQPMVQSQAVSVPPSPEQPRSASFATVQFELGSANLRPDATQALDTLAAVLSHPSLAQDRFIIEGHTDASGSAAYNQALSERRAQAVVSYLVSHDGIDPSRLTWVGRGEGEPLDASNPYNPANRRVVVLNIGQ